jgi:hypothetical protein
MRVVMRQIAGVFSQLEKTRLVKKLKAARDRKRVHGKVEGRRSHVELHPEVVEEAKRLARASATAWVLLRAPSLVCAFFRWLRTVSAPISSALATSDDCAPIDANRRTASSRGVS